MHYFVALALLASRRYTPLHSIWELTQHQNVRDLLFPLQDKDHIMVALSQTRITSRLEVDHIIKKVCRWEEAKDYLI